MLPHFANISMSAYHSEYCSICGKSATTYGFGDSRYSDNLYAKNLCQEHYKLYLRKQKLEKLNNIKDI